ncbi:MAG: NUDIX hydrolase [Ignavibacteria bacterium]|nr:NUDIX hydrolase [Ignavibacteria bacterium]
MQPWKTRDRVVVLDRGKFLRAEDHIVQLPDGTTIEQWPWLVLPEYVNVIPETTDGKFLLFRQTKYAVGGVTLAPVGGYCEPGEDPGEAAVRELREETGYSAEEWIDLGHYVVDGNRGAGKAHLYYARGARHTSERSADDLEEQELLMLSRTQLRRVLEDGEVKVLSWAACIAMALMYKNP